MLGDAILAIVLLVMGGYILNEVNAYPDYSNLSVIGPEVFPKLIAIFFIISAIWFLATVIWKGWIKKVDADGNSYIEKEKAKVQAGVQSMQGNKTSIIHLVITIILMIAYALLLPTVGFEVLTIVFLIATMFMNGVRKPHVLLIVSVVSVVIIYIFFVMILKVQIPRMFYF
ncbi:tripartite tricarboxylate transporter TctB family protein [Faecalicatena contorta]|uniref:tripartite tricarboxylate transporter TctB family protein n=1 Tax=Faecalicatena contorta TaxID=39482 RepID=UPI001F300DD4|nr:tripartite tricarboxylate transporter TctB family protein [Faecalicatena contorta]MCF2682263.1 tripartite tricarboxylate transporter TctB family protein [Faecalicatena contorta]